MKKSTIAAAAIAFALPILTVLAVDIPYDQSFNGRTFVNGRWYLDGTELLPSAAEINILSGLTATTAQLNALGGGSSVIGIAQITNALATGTYVVKSAGMTGNAPIAAITNALSTAGPNVGGNIPLASVTNALATATGALTTNVIIDASFTNTIVLRLVGGKLMVESWTKQAL